MKGSLHTDELMGAVVAREGGIRTERRSIAHIVGQWPLFQHCNRPRCRLRMIAIRSSRRSAVARTNAWSARIPTDPTGTTNETVAPDCGLSRNVTDAPRLARRPGKPPFRAERPTKRQPGRSRRRSPHASRPLPRGGRSRGRSRSGPRKDWLLVRKRACV